MMLLTLRGTAFLYQGQELGLPDAHVPPEARVDVGDRDPERAPMPWEPPTAAGRGAGFTDGVPWLPIVDEAEALAWSVQDGDPRSTLSLFRCLIRLRRETPALRDGDQTMLDAGPEGLAWTREGGGERWMVALNMSLREGATRISLPEGATGTLVISTDPDRVEGPVGLEGLELGIDEGVVIRLDDFRGPG